MLDVSKIKFTEVPEPDGRIIHVSATAKVFSTLHVHVDVRERVIDGIRQDLTDGLWEACYGEIIDAVNESRIAAIEAAQGYNRPVIDAAFNKLYDLLKTPQLTEIELPITKLTMPVADEEAAAAAHFCQ